MDGAKEWEIVKAIILPNLRFHIMFIALWDTLGLLTDYVNILLITVADRQSEARYGRSPRIIRHLSHGKYGYGAGDSAHF